MAKVTRNILVWTLVVAVGVMAPVLSAQQPTPPAAGSPQTQQPTTAVPMTMQQSQPIDKYVVGRALPPNDIVPGREMKDLTLEQAIAIALEKNLDLKATKMEPQSVDYQLAAARASFIPSMNAGYTFGNSTTASNNTLEGVTYLTDINQGFNGGVNHTLPWFGSSYQARFTNTRRTTNNITTRLNPSYSSQASIDYSMPILSGFKMDNTRNQLRTLGITRQISDINVLAAVENLRNQVRVSYWALRSSIEQIEISKRALDIARQSFDQSRMRVEIGTSAPIDTVQFETAVFNQEQLLLAAQIGWRTAEINFKRFLASGADDEIYKFTLNPIDSPELSVQSVDIQAAMTKALAERTDLIVARRNIDSSNLSLEVSKSQTLPNLALTAGYRLTGQGGTQRLPDGSFIPGGIADALSAIGGFDTPAWNLGFNLTYPLGMRAAKANFARSILALDQSQARLKASELNVQTEVVNAGLNVENTYKQYEASQKARQAAERNADAAQTRFDVGMATNFEVVQLQNQLTTSRLQELSRLIAYVNAVAEFDRVQRVGR
jgi:outer membrane protein TolC